MYSWHMSSNIALTKSPKQLAIIAEQLKALGDETRLELIVAVAASENSEACVCDLTPATGLSQGTVSHHLKILMDSNLLVREQRGKWAYYSLTSAAKEILKVLKIPTTPKLAKRCRC